MLTKKLKQILENFHKKALSLFKIGLFMKLKFTAQ